jgi:hypothetical protein
MSQYPGNDDRDDLVAALSFSGSGESADDGGEESAIGALSAYAPVADSDEESAVDTLHAYAPVQTEETETQMETIRTQSQTAEEEEEDEASLIQMFTVTNPPQTVSVSALIDGRTQQIDLSPKAASMSEPELVEEIIILADLARQKGLAGQHSYLLGNEFLVGSIGGMGYNSNEVLRDFMENGIGMPTPEKAAEAQAEVFAARYKDVK